MNYNFDEQVNREHTASVKYDLRKLLFGKEDVIPMWVADMDFKTPPFIIDAIKKRLNHEILGYTFRAESFNESVATWMHKRHGWNVEKDWICFSPGVVPSFNLAILAYTQPGDKIIVQKPVYFPFFPAIENHNRILVNNPLKLVNGRYEMDFEDLIRKIDDEVKMILFCSPHNPAGNVWKKEELEKLARVCLEKNILIVSDEIHSDLIFKGNNHIPTASLSNEIGDITITLAAPSKTFNTAGLSTSVLIISNKKLRKQYEKILENVHVGGGNIFGFIALEAAYNHGEEWLFQLMEYLQKNLDFLLEYFKNNIPQIKPVIPEATYMVWLDCREMGLKSYELKKHMIEKAELGLSEGITFGKEEGEGFMRMNFACPRVTLEKALTKLRESFE